jgi:hypothetical protein
MPGGYSRATLRDYVQAAASVFLAPHFEDQSPDYPVFSMALTRQNRSQAVQDALRWIGGGLKTKTGNAVLDALELLDGDRLDPRRSRYAKHVLEALAGKGHGQVINRSDLVQDEGGVAYWGRFRIEPEFLSVVLASLVSSGDIVLSLTGKRVDAAAIDQLARLPVDDVVAFKHIERPRDLPLAPLTDLCEMLGVPKGLMVNPASRDEGVAQLQVRVAQLVGGVVAAQNGLGELVVWGRSILSEQELAEWRQRLAAAKSFLESLQPFNTPAKLKNFPHSTEQLAAQKTNLALIRDVEELLALAQQMGPLCAYLGTAEGVLGTAHPWAEAARTTRGELLAKVGSPKHRSDATFQRALGRTLAELKVKYQDSYLAAHQAARLGVNDDKKKAGLAKDSRLVRLQKLAQVDMMPTQQLRAVEEQLFGIKTCFALTRQELDASPICPHCHMRPVEELTAAAPASATLMAVDERLDGLVGEWTETLLTNLEDPTVQANIELVTDAKGKRAVGEFRKTRELPEAVSPAFLRALQEVLSGLTKVVLTPDALRGALVAGGVPCTVADLKERFDRYVSEITKGKDPAKVRIVVE